MFVHMDRTASGVPHHTWEEPFANDVMALTSAVQRNPLAPSMGVLFVHGASSTRRAMGTTDALRPLRDIVIDAGAVIAECGGNGDAPRDRGLNWGRPYALEAYRSVVQRVERRHEITSWLLIGRSMGGVVAKQILLDDDLRPRVSAYLDSAGMFDLIAGWRTQANVRRYLRQTWRVNTEAALRERTGGRDPGRRDWARVDLAGVRVCVVTGGADHTVLAEHQGQAFARRAAQSAREVREHHYPRRGHSSTATGVLSVPEARDFVRSVLPAAALPAPEPGRAVAAYAADGRGGFRRSRVI